MNIIASMGIEVGPVADMGAFAQAGAKAGEGFLTAFSAASEDFQTGVKMGEAFTAGLKEALSGREMDLGDLFKMSDSVLKPLEDSIGKVLEKIPLIGGAFKSLEGDLQSVYGLSESWLSMVVEIGDKWQGVSRVIAGETLDTGKIDKLSESVQNLFASGHIVREQDIIGNLAEFHTRIGLAGEDLEKFTLTYSLANEVMNTTLNADNITGILNMFHQGGDEASETLTQLTNIFRASGSDANQMLTTMKMLGTSFSELGYNAPEMALMFSQLDKAGVSIDRLSFAFSGFISKAEKAVNDGKFKDLNDVYTQVLHTAIKLGEVNDKAAETTLLREWFGPKGALAILKGLELGVIKTAEDMKKIAFPEEFGEDLEEAVEKTKNFPESFAQIQRQMEAGFKPVGQALISTLDATSSTLSNWLGTHQSKVIHWAADVTASAAGIFAGMTSGFAAALNVLAMPMEVLKDIILASFGPMMGLIEGVVSILDGLSGTKIGDVLGLDKGTWDSTKKSIDELAHDWGAALKYNLHTPITDASKLLDGLADKAKDWPDLIREGAESRVLEAQLGEAFMIRNDDTGHLTKAVEATAEGKLAWKKGVSDESKEAIVGKLHELGIEVGKKDGAYDLNSLTARSVAAAEDLQAFFEHLASGKITLQTKIMGPDNKPIPVPDKPVVPNITEEIPQPKFMPDGSINPDWHGYASDRGPKVEIPAVVHPSAYMPKMSGEDWFPSGSRPAKWAVKYDGTLQVPAEINPDDSQVTPKTAAQIMDVMGIPLELQGQDGVVMNVSWSSSGGVALPGTVNAGYPGGSVGMPGLAPAEANLHGVHPQIGLADQIAVAMGLHLSAGKDNHDPDGGWHPAGQAGDFSNDTGGWQKSYALDNTPQQEAFAHLMLDNFAPYIEELIYNSPTMPYLIANGQVGKATDLYGSADPLSDSVLAKHPDHVHLAIKDGMYEAFMAAVQAATAGGGLPAGLPALFNAGLRGDAGGGGAGGGSLWDAIAEKESSNDWSNNNTGGFSGSPRGGLQIKDATWAMFGGTEFAATANLATREQQIVVARRIAFGGYNGVKPQGLKAWEVLSNGPGGASSVPGVTVNTPESAFGSAAPVVPPVDEIPYVQRPVKLTDSESDLPLFGPMGAGDGGRLAPPPPEPWLGGGGDFSSAPASVPEPNAAADFWSEAARLSSPSTWLQNLGIDTNTDFWKGDWYTGKRVLANPRAAAGGAKIVGDQDEKLGFPLNAVTDITLIPDVYPNFHTATDPNASIKDRALAILGLVLQVVGIFGIGALVKKAGLAAIEGVLARGGTIKEAVEAGAAAIRSESARSGESVPGSPNLVPVEKDFFDGLPDDPGTLNAAREAAAARRSTMPRPPRPVPDPTDVSTWPSNAAGGAGDAAGDALRSLADGGVSNDQLAAQLRAVLGGTPAAQVGSDTESAAAAALRALLDPSVSNDAVSDLIAAARARDVVPSDAGAAVGGSSVAQLEQLDAALAEFGRTTAPAGGVRSPFDPAATSGLGQQGLAGIIL